MTKGPSKINPGIPARYFVLALAVILVVLLSMQWSARRKTERRVEPVISELQAYNQTGLRDDAGNLSDWLEIWNPTDQPIQLAGYFLTDDFRNLKKWRFPERTLGPNEFLIVFASGRNQTNRLGPLHTNFRLDPQGEYLALVDRDGKQVLQEFLPKYPGQYGDGSFGIRQEFFKSDATMLAHDMRDMTFLLEPSPGKPNTMELLGLVADTRFTEKRGWHEGPIRVGISTRTIDSTIRFTLDGSVPTATSGMPYLEPLLIDRTTVLRAAAFRPGFRPSNVDTHTYLFDDTGRGEFPVLSLVMAGPLSDEEQSVSLEILYSDDGTGEQIDCGLRTQLDPYNPSRPTLRLRFDNQFGAPEFKHRLLGKGGKTFNELEIRSEEPSAMIAALWVDQTMRDLGRPASRGRLINLFINGHEEGIKRVSERADLKTIARQLGGSEASYEIRRGATPISGPETAWMQLFTPEANAPGLDEIGRVLDVPAFIDFMLVNLFVGNRDLGTDDGWIAVRGKGTGYRFQFLPESTGLALEEVTVNTFDLDAPRSPQRLFRQLVRNDAFRDQVRRRAAELLENELSLDAARKRLSLISNPEPHAAELAALNRFLEQRRLVFKNQLVNANLL